MKAKILMTALMAMLVFPACDVHMAPSSFWSKLGGSETDSAYYQEKAQKLVESVAKASREYDINKVAVIDFVDESGKVPVLGEYMASRVVEQIAQSRSFRVAQKGDVKETLTKLSLMPSQLYSKDEAQKIGKSLNSQALITGKITDIGTNLDVSMTLVDISTGEVISSATESMTRTKFSVEMSRHYQ